MNTELVSIAAEITREHEATCRAVRTGVEHARRAGELLMQAKAGVEHGGWLPWLTEHCPTVPIRTAQAYMRIAARWPELEAAANTQRVAHLPVRQALALLAEPREPVEIPAWLADGDHRVDWLARTAQMEAAWDDLGAALDELSARIVDADDPSALVDAIDEATALEGRAVALHASTIRDLRHLTRELARLLDLPIPLVRPLTKPERMEAFMAACHARIAELAAQGG